MASDKNGAPNPYAYRGRYLLSAYNDQYKDVSGKDPCDFDRPTLGKAPAPEKVSTDPPKLPICIIGAGVTGLYTAMIFETLGFKYHIIEASNRVGGRLFTYRFPNEEEKTYDYFDVGAMRFPRTPFMKRTFNLIEERKLEGLRLIPYILSAPNTRLFYNNAHIINGNTSKPGAHDEGKDPQSDDPFGVEAYITDKRLTTPEGVAEVVGEVLQPFRNFFVPSNSGRQLDIDHAMKLLFKRTNNFSMRGYMLLVHRMSPNDVHWCETLDDSTGSYDRSLTEVVIETLAFDWPDVRRQHGWFCIDGGSDLLPKAMFDSLLDDPNPPQGGQKKSIMFNSAVTAIAQSTRKGNDGKPDEEFMKISIDGKEQSQEYSAVISTIPLSRLSLVDLNKANIHANYSQWSAIRSLQYEPSTKVGIRFKEAWWENKYRIHGGQSKTDLPLRTIVYPSYPDPSSGKPPSKVLIVSYCWTQDADRLGTFILPDGTVRNGLLDLVFRDLAAVHGTTVDVIRGYYEEKKENCFAWDWSRDPLTMGAFALFGPGVYEEGGLYGEILKPAANGKLFFAGEATSACHAWVAGALDSAWRAVDRYLALHYRDLPAESNGTPVHNPVRRKFWESWGGSEYWDEKTNEELVQRNHKVSMRNLMINVIKDIPDNPTREKSK